MSQNTSDYKYDFSLNGFVTHNKSLTDALIENKDDMAQLTLGSEAN